MQTPHACKNVTNKGEKPFVDFMELDYALCSHRLCFVARHLVVLSIIALYR